MKAFVLFVVALAVLSSARADGEADKALRDENSRLKARLSQLKSELQPLHEETARLVAQNEALKTVDELMLGERLAVPPREEHLGDIVFSSGEKVYDVVARERGKDVEEKVWLKNAKELRGRRIAVEAMVKGEDVVLCKGKGSKFGLYVPRPGGKTQWPSVDIGAGTPDWTCQRFVYDVPLDADGICILMGHEGSTGRLCFKEVKVYAK